MFAFRPYLFRPSGAIVISPLWGYCDFAPLGLLRFRPSGAITMSPLRGCAPSDAEVCAPSDAETKRHIIER